MSFVHQDLQVHPDREERKEPGDEEDREGNKETKEIKELWDHQEKVASKASWDLLGRLAKLVLKDKKETLGLQACRDLKESLVNQFQHLLFAVSPARSTINESGSATFKCSVIGNPTPTVVWSKLNSQTNISQSLVSEETLRLQNLKGSDAGVYECSAINILGQAYAVGQLAVNGKLICFRGFICYYLIART